MNTRRAPTDSKKGRRLARAKHATVHIAHGGLKAEVDRGIAPLVLELWKAGIMTRQSCQADAQGRVWIQFQTTADLVRFLEIVTRNDFKPGSLCDRALYGYDRIAVPAPRQWQYEVVVHDFATDEIEVKDGVWREIRLGPPDFRVFTSVRFPRCDIITALRRLQKHNRMVRLGACER